jgi:hypothetical protein
MGTLESRIEHRACLKILQHLGVESIKLNVHGQTGLPDRMFLIPGGKPVFIEFKRPGGVVSKKQEYMRKLLTRLGYPVYICDSVENAFVRICAHWIP